MRNPDVLSDENDQEVFPEVRTHEGGFANDDGTTWIHEDWEIYPQLSEHKCKTIREKKLLRYGITLRGSFFMGVRFSYPLWGAYSTSGLKNSQISSKIPP